MSRRRSMRLFCAALATGLAAAASGCERSTATVAGVVTLDGRPLEGVHLVFEPLEPAAEAAAVTDGVGRYELGEGAGSRAPRPGACRVRLFTSDHDPPAGQPLVVERIPAAYHSVIHFHVDLEPGFNRIDFELSSEPTAGKGRNEGEDAG